MAAGFAAVAFFAATLDLGFCNCSVSVFAIGEHLTASMRRWMTRGEGTRRTRSRGTMRNAQRGYLYCARGIELTAGEKSSDSSWKLETADSTSESMLKYVRRLRSPGARKAMGGVAQKERAAKGGAASDGTMKRGD